MPNIATVKKTKKAKTKKETINSDLPEKSSNSFMDKFRKIDDKTREVTGKIGGHLKRNWKRYALGAAVAGAAGYKYGGSNADASASANVDTNASKPTKKPVDLKDVKPHPLLGLKPIPTEKSTVKQTPTVVEKPKTVYMKQVLDDDALKNSTIAGLRIRKNR